MKTNHLTTMTETTLTLKSAALLSAMALALISTAACSSSAPGSEGAFTDESGAGGAAPATTEATGSFTSEEDTGTDAGAGGAPAGESEQEETPEKDEDPWDGLQLELVTEFSHPLEAPDGFTYCGKEYETMCGALTKLCNEEGGTFECHESESPIPNVCDTWGSCRDKPELFFTDAEGEEIPPPKIGDIQADTDVQAKCAQCNAICQTVSLFGSAYDELHLGEGYTPSGCVDAAADLCEGGASRWLFSANCVM